MDEGTQKVSHCAAPVRGSRPNSPLPRSRPAVTFLSDTRVPVVNKPFLLVQLSDPHIGATWGFGDPMAGLRAAVEAVRRLPDQPDAVLMSGDLADNATDGEYEFVRESLARLGAPVYVLSG
jgi:predicted MPP superfamily phosphohydrolase